jgi:hypothetical protein
MRSLGLLLDHANPLLALEELSQNFPLYSSAIAQASALSSASDDETAHGARLKEVWENRQLWEQLGPSTGGGPVAAGGGAGRTVEGRMWLGGREVGEKDLGVFT